MKSKSIPKTNLTDYLNETSGLGQASIHQKPKSKPTSPCFTETAYVIETPDCSNPHLVLETSMNGQPWEHPPYSGHILRIKTDPDKFDEPPIIGDKFQLTWSHNFEHHQLKPNIRLDITLDSENDKFDLTPLKHQQDLLSRIGPHISNDEEIFAFAAGYFRDFGTLHHAFIRGSENCGFLDVNSFAQALVHGLLDNNISYNSDLNSYPDAFDTLQAWYYGAYTHYGNKTLLHEGERFIRLELEFLKIYTHNGIPLIDYKRKDDSQGQVITQILRKDEHNSFLKILKPKPGQTLQLITSNNYNTKSSDEFFNQYTPTVRLISQQTSNEPTIIHRSDLSDSQSSAITKKFTTTEAMR